MFYLSNCPFGSDIETEHSSSEDSRLDMMLTDAQVMVGVFDPTPPHP